MTKVQKYSIFLYSARIEENTDQKNLPIWALFTQWMCLHISLSCHYNSSICFIHQMLLAEALVQRCFIKRVLKKLAVIIGKHLCWSFFLINVLSCEYCKIFENSFFIKHLSWLLLVWTLISFFYNSFVTVRNYLNAQGKIWNILQGGTSLGFRFIRKMTALYERQFSSKNTYFVNRGKYFLWPWIGSAKSHEWQLFSVIGS